MQSILCYFAYSESHLSHLTWNRSLSICDSPFDVLYSIFSVAFYFFFSHIDLFLCHIFSKILWLKQDTSGMELPPSLLFSAYIFIFNKISWLLDLFRWTHRGSWLYFHITSTASPCGVWIQLVERVHIHTINIIIPKPGQSIF